MLHLLGPSPVWRAERVAHVLPNTLPGWTIAFLVLQGDWVSRERLAALLWPDIAPAEALHNLRMDLHRVRPLLAEWGVAPQLETERRRVRLALPTDAALLQDTLRSTEASLPLAPGALLAGFTFEGFVALREWAELERAALAGRWREAALARLEHAAAPEASALAQALLDADPLDDMAMQHLLRALHSAGRGADAQRHFATYRDRVRRELGVEPAPALQALAGGPAAVAAAPGEGGAFLGRRIELTQLAERLAASRWVTLAGPGGIGKSRLAREAVARLDRPALWIELQDLVSLEEVQARVAQRLEVSLREGGDVPAQLARALGGVARLLVLDNAEHLAGEVAGFAAQCLAASPALSVLVTSRQPLGGSGESVMPLDGLALPDADSRDAQAASAFDAVRLFEARARAVQPGFTLEPWLSAVLEIVDAVGGSPLAIELAAAWLRLMPAYEIARQLRAGMDALERDPAEAGLPARPEHTSLQVVLDRTWSLLSPQEQAALRAMSVFHGSFTAAAARAVGAIAMQTLAPLTDKGLVRADPDTGRFSLHALVAAQARERSASEGAAELPALRARHAAHFAARLDEAAREQPFEHRALVALIEQEGADARQAWRHAIDAGDVEQVQRTASAWRRYAVATGRYAEGTRHFEAALELAGAGTAARRARAVARAALAWLAKNREQAERAIAVALEVLAEARALGDTELEVDALNTLGAAELLRGRWPEARAWYEQALERAEARALRRETASALNNLGLVGLCEGRFDGCDERLQRAAALQREMNDQVSLARTLHNLGSLQMAHGRWSDACAANDEALRHARAHRVESILLITEFMQGATLIELDRPEAAQRHLEAARTLCAAQDDDVFDFKCRYYLLRLRARAGEAAASAALLDAVREARQRDAGYDLLYIAAFIAEAWQRDGALDAAARLLCAVEAAPLADAFVRATLDAIGPRAVQAPPFERCGDVLQGAADSADARARVEALTLR